MNQSILIAGCAPNSGNMGVSALFYSVIDGLLSRKIGKEITAFGYGQLDQVVQISNEVGAETYRLYGLNHSRRFYNRFSISSLELQDRLGICWSPLARLFSGSPLLLDISGGDSFSDLYGTKRFDSICFPKERMLRLGKKLLLLPQTYGPFGREECKLRAQRIVQGAEAAWARDCDSFQVLQDLLGNQFDPKRHRQGVDVAFLLPTRKPKMTDASDFPIAGEEKWIGLNVSGLIYNDPVKSKTEFQLKADYVTVVHSMIQALLAQSEHRIALIPHVFGDYGRDSDPSACQAVYNQIDPRNRSRLWIAPNLNDPREIKWLISQCDWFCGTRMHATIAALSSRVPTASIAYSMKTRGVFESCGVGDQVIDPRSLHTQEVVEQTLLSFHSRDSVRKRLADALPKTISTAEEQMDEIAKLCIHAT